MELLSNFAADEGDAVPQVERPLRVHSMVLAIALLAISVATRTAVSAGPALPSVEVKSIRRVFDNGEHNAFTDLCRYRERYYLTFRTCPDGHGVFPTSSILVLSSDDGRQWREVHRFSIPQRDVRDPHFLEFQGRLFVYTGTWYCGDSAPESRDMNDHLGYAAWTEDGAHWQGPQMLEGTYGHYIWRAATQGAKAYLCGRRIREFQPAEKLDRRDVESALLESDDGLIWRKAGLFQEEYGDETAFLFEPDGAILAVVRGGGNRSAQVCRSRPPYGQWERHELGRAVGGPLLARWNGHYLVGGRKSLGEPRTALYWLAGDQLQEIAELESGGDNSYPGFVELDDGRAWVSYYSSHERDADGRPITAIYLAELAFRE